MTSPFKKVVFLVTGNIHKFNEARLVLKEFGLSAAMLNIDTIETQDDDLENVAKASIIDALRKCHLPIIIEDAGLFIDALNGFPGPYSSYAFRTIGNKGILKIMKDTEKRSAAFNAVIAFHMPGFKLPKCFQGKVEGKITTQIRGTKGFGFDPIFQPNTFIDKTFAEMSTSQKNKHSHRAEALRKFAEWYTKSLEH